jgi:hypothetical protein
VISQAKARGCILLVSQLIVPALCVAAEPALPPPVVQAPVPAGVTVVQSTNVGRSCAPCAARPAVPPAPCPTPCPAAPSIPAGLVVVQSSYLEQVSATAKAAIDSARSNEESLVEIMKVCGWVLAALIGTATFFGFKEYRAIQLIHEKLSKNLRITNEKRKKIEAFADTVAPGMLASMNDLREMEAIMIDVAFLGMSLAELIDTGSKDEQEMRRSAEKSLPRARDLLARAKKLYERRRDGSEVPGLQSNVEELERVLSYISSGVGIIAMRAGANDEAIRAMELSVEHNPLEYTDRRFNLACALAKRYGATRNDSDRIRAIQLLEEDLASGVWEWNEVITDTDLESIRADLMQSKHAPKASDQQGQQAPPPA